MIQNYGDGMLKIKNNRLYITQGDTLNLKVNLRNNDGSIYEMNDTDTLTYVIRKDDIKLLGTIKGSNKFTIQANKMDTLIPGRYQMEITLKTVDNQSYTVFGITGEDDYNLIIYPLIANKG